MKNLQYNDLNIQTAQEYQNTQNYVSTLFDSLPKVDLSQQGKDLIKKLLEQNQLYGKKIIELSEKFTSFYRKDHIIDRKDVQQKIKSIYQILLDQQVKKQMQIDEMLTTALKKLKSDSYNMIKAGYQQLQQSQSRNYNLQNISEQSRTVESKISLKNVSGSRMQQSIGISNQNLYLDNLHPNGGNVESVTASRKQSMQSKNNKSSAKSKKQKDRNLLQEQEIPLKKILKIKGYLEEQENIIKQMFQKINTKLSELKISKLNISSQKFTYTKVQDQTNKENLQSLLEASNLNHRTNLSNIAQVLDLIFADFNRKINDEMQSESKFTLYTKEIQKRQQVYSYAVSKLIGQVNNMKNYLLQQKYHDCMEISENLISISTKFYQLYPSNSIIKDLKVKSQKKQFEILGQRNYAVQVNVTKQERNISRVSTDSNRNLMQYQLQSFKLQTKLGDIFERFQKNNMKFKKSVQIKQVSRLMSSIKELFPDRTKNNAPFQNPQIVKFQQEYKKLSFENQQKQQKWVEQTSKKEKKYEKIIKQLQQTIKAIQNQRERQLQTSRQEAKKLTRKLENLRQNYKTTQKRSQQNQKIVKSVKDQIQGIKRKYRQEELKYLHKYEEIERKTGQLNRQVEQKQSQIKLLSENQSEKASQSQTQIMLYKKKIVLLQDKNSSLIYENEDLLRKLQNLSVSSTFSKQKLAQMAQIYEKNINQVDSLIEKIKQMKIQIEEKDERIIQLELQIQNAAKIDEKLSEQLLKQKKVTADLRELIQSEQKQKQKIKEVRQLNQTDIQKLKDEINKVHTMYMESEEQLENLRGLYEDLQEGYNQLQQQNGKFKSVIDDLRRASSKSSSLQKQLRQVTQANSSLQEQVLQSSSKCKHLQNQLYLLKKQSKHLRQEEVDQSRQLRQLRQQVQKLKEEQSLLKGKNKIDLQSLKIQLRKKSQECAKIKEMYEEKIELVEGKYKELQKFVTQKEMLSKIANSHMTQ